MTATVPEGWQGIRGETFANLFQTNDDFPAGSISLSLPDNFYVDPCDTSAGLWDPPLGPTVDDFVTALANVPGYTTTEPDGRRVPRLQGQVHRGGGTTVGHAVRRRVLASLADEVQRDGPL